MGLSSRTPYIEDRSGDVLVDDGEPLLEERGVELLDVGPRLVARQLLQHALPELHVQ